MDRDRRGFTLLEMVVVLGIMAVLALVAVKALEPVADQSRYEATQRTLTNIEEAILGGQDLRQPDGTPIISGFIADVGRPPLVQGSLPETQLAELWDGTLSVSFPFGLLPGPTGYDRHQVAVRMAWTLFAAGRRSFRRARRLAERVGDTAGDGIQSHSGDSLERGATVLRESPDRCYTGIGHCERNSNQRRCSSGSVHGRVAVSQSEPFRDDPVSDARFGHRPWDLHVHRCAGRVARFTRRSTANQSPSTSWSRATV